jgi:hypothetical protein
MRTASLTVGLHTDPLTHPHIVKITGPDWVGSFQRRIEAHPEDAECHPQSLERWPHDPEGRSAGPRSPSPGGKGLTEA